MRTLITAKDMESGHMAFVWAGYCLKVDNLRRELIPGYDPAKLSDVDQMRDWNNFKSYYAAKYGEAQ